MSDSRRISFLNSASFITGVFLSAASSFMLQANAQTSPEARVLYVNSAIGNDTTTAGSETAPYRTISYAIQQSKAGTTIRVAAGTYSAEMGEQFPLEVKPGVSLRGNDAAKGDSVLIRGGGGYLSPTFARQNTAIVAQQGSTIQGLTITNPNTRGTGIWIESGNATIANNTFTNNLREGVFVSGNAAPRITNNVFSRNSASGVSVARSAQGEVSNNVFDNTGFGIQVSESAAPLLMNNQITHNQDGIVISHTSHPVLRQNHIENNVRYGVVVISDAKPDFGTSSTPGSNTLKNNGQSDLYDVTQNSSLLIDGNQIGKVERAKVDRQSDASDAPTTSASR